MMRLFLLSVSISAGLASKNASMLGGSLESGCRTEAEGGALPVFAQRVCYKYCLVLSGSCAAFCIYGHPPEFSFCEESINFINSAPNVLFAAGPNLPFG